MDIAKLQSIATEANKVRFALGQLVQYYAGKKTGYVEGKVVGFHQNGDVLVEANGKTDGQHPLSLVCILK